MIKIDITGQKFNKLTAIKQIIINNRRTASWLFKCDCGKSIEKRISKVTSGHVKTCGCAKNIDITGQRFGKLVVINKLSKQKWNCLCDCGNTSEVHYSNLMNKNGTKSCGCNRIGQNSNKYKDGRTKHKDYAYDYKLQKNYGIDIKHYKEMLKNQSNRCLICFNLGGTGKQRLVVDHDHETGKVRGLLCNPCNRGLGYLKDSTDVLLNALRYLGKNKDGVKIAITLYENV